jgi:nitrous oxide reductase accessory protein NosL
MALQTLVKIFKDEGEAKAFAAGIMNPGEVVHYVEVTDGVIVTTRQGGKDQTEFSANGSAYVVTALNIK